MNILYLEDRGSAVYNVEHWLRTDGHNVFSALHADQAQAYWRERRRVPVHSILLDLQVSMHGLTDEQKADAEGGTLAGWVWLRDNVLAEAPEMRQRTIIYSDYIDVLRARVREEQYRGIKLVSKAQSGNPADAIMACIREIARMKPI